MGAECLQESESKKALWLEEMKVLFPVGCPVRVIDETYPVGTVGTVYKHDVGIMGDYPMLLVEFAVGAEWFYDDELLALETHEDRIAALAAWSQDQDVR